MRNIWYLSRIQTEQNKLSKTNRFSSHFERTRGEKTKYFATQGITENGDKEGSSFEVKFSMLEIYNEVAIDLLDAKNSGKKKQSGLKIRQHPKRGFYGT